jgi:hypothetical protein
MRPKEIVRPFLDVSAAAAALMMLVTTSAGAQESVPAERSYLQQHIPARSQAFELTVATGYTQGFGTLQPGIGMPQVAHAGIGVDAAVGYRIDPHYSVSIGAGYQELEAERDDAVRGFALDLALQYHLAPAVRVDPWLEVGSGYRVLWLVPFGTAQTVAVHGPELIRVRAGLDLRISADVAISPVIGADATMFVFREEQTLSTIPDPKLSTFVFAGVQGRLDLGGVRIPSPTVASARGR